MMVPEYRLACPVCGGSVYVVVNQAARDYAGMAAMCGDCNCQWSALVEQQHGRRNEVYGTDGSMMYYLGIVDNTPGRKETDGRG